VFGRGNQQFSPALIRKVIDQHQPDNILLVASNEKLRTLNGRPMIVDTGDTELDTRLAGMVQVITGYEQRTLYKLGY
ncbi:MAG: ATP-NAD kinase, partial [Gammaproteobacteria bacterium]